MRWIRLVLDVLPGEFSTDERWRHFMSNLVVAGIVKVAEHNELNLLGLVLVEERKALRKREAHLLGIIAVLVLAACFAHCWLLFRANKKQNLEGKTNVRRMYSFLKIHILYYL